MQLVLVRHGLPVIHRAAPGEGADPALAPEGIAQAEALARWLAHEPITAVVSSPLRRARETAAPVAAAFGLDVQIADGVAEFDRGSHEYVPMEHLDRDDPRWQTMLEGNYYTSAEADDGTTTITPIDPAEFSERVVAAIDDIVADHRGGRVVVACHGGVLNTYLAHVLGRRPGLFFRPSYTGICRVEASSRGHRSVVSIDETGHLHPTFGPR